MRLAVGTRTHVGQIREGNEDSHLVDERLGLYAVADGMGGHRGGEVASATAIEALRAAVAAGKSIDEAVKRANGAVIERGEGDPGLHGMATTLTAAIAVGGSALLLGHVGDSRAYLLRDGELSRLTEDHSLVEELVREGRLTPEQAEVHPQRSIVTRGLGIEPDVEVDLTTVQVRPGDRVLLCSDGLTGMVRERDVAAVLRAERDPQRAAERLVDLANEAGGEDNITVVLVDVVEVDAPAPPDPEALAEPAPRATPTPVAASDAGADVPAAAPRSAGRRVRSAVLLVVPLLLVVGIAFGAIGWYARRSYFVGLHGDRVALYKGVPGGVLFWDETVEVSTDLRASELTAIERENVAEGAARGSRDRAEAYLQRLEDGVAERVAATTTTTEPRRPRRTTTTTEPPRRRTTTTTARP